jgi:hypothetical protein
MRTITTLALLFTLTVTLTVASKRNTYRIRIHQRPTHQDESFEEYKPEVIESWSGAGVDRSDSYDESNDFAIDDGHAVIHAEIDVSADHENFDLNIHSNSNSNTNKKNGPQYDRVFGDHSRQHQAKQTGLFMRQGSELGIGALATLLLVFYLL